ncbi:Thymus-specific serine protease [Massospora cicadina]|nr:Thymus-specific serine protease [Massospora cicadina]
MKFNLALVTGAVICSFSPFRQLLVDERELDDLDIQSGERSLQLLELWFDQKIDHLEPSNATYKQRYFMNPQHYKPGGPAFLFIGGEAELNSKWARLSLLTKAAEVHGGVIFALEHRYYGKSWPTPDFSTKNLRYLSSRQALADMANFMSNVKMPKGQMNREGNTQRWIVAGGSYPGNLAAWVRAKYPHIVAGAIASSAPVLAKEDFFEYDQQVQKSLSRNGGEACANYYQEVVGAIDAGLSSGDRNYINQLKGEFGCSGVSDLSFVDGLTYISAKVQYNRGDLLKDHCRSLNLNGTIFAKLADFASDFKRELDGKTCEEYTNLDQAYSIVPNKDNNLRQWIYQCCTEFGYWQTAPHVALFRNHYCKGLFGEDGPSAPHINRTNDYYQGFNINATNIFFTNGELDPWAPLSITSPKEEILTFVMEGASHARDLGYPNPNDPLPVSLAKDQALSLISRWLKDG